MFFIQRECQLTIELQSQFKLLLWRSEFLKEKRTFHAKELRLERNYSSTLTTKKLRLLEIFQKVKFTSICQILFTTLSKMVSMLELKILRLSSEDVIMMLIEPFLLMSFSSSPKCQVVKEDLSLKIMESSLKVKIRAQRENRCKNLFKKLNH